MGTAEEIRDKIIQFRKSGKFAIAYGEIMTDAGYYIATACDKIYLNPKGILEFNGFAGQTALYKGMFDKIGLEFEVFKAGKYKSAVEPFIQDKISDANREQIKQYVFELFGHCMRNIAIARRSDSASIADIANTFKARNAKAAKQYNLVDALTYEDELEEQLKTLVGAKKGAKLNLMSFGKYAKNSWIQGEGKQKIALIYAEGDINMGKNESGDGIGSESMAATIKKASV
jgi:protease-4